MGLGAVAGARGIPYLGRQEFNAMSAQDRRQTRLGGAIAGATVGAGIGAIAQYYMNKDGEPDRNKEVKKRPQ